MKIKIIRVDETTIGAFAEKHGLTMTVNERNLALRSSGLPRFYCAFDGIEVKVEGGLLAGIIGGGETITEVIADYCAQISCKKLVYNAYQDDRREILVPVLTPEWDEELV